MLGMWLHGQRISPRKGTLTKEDEGKLDAQLYGWGGRQVTQRWRSQKRTLGRIRPARIPSTSPAAVGVAPDGGGGLPAAETPRPYRVPRSVNTSAGTVFMRDACSVFGFPVGALLFLLPRTYCKWDPSTLGFGFDRNGEDG